MGVTENTGRARGVRRREMLLGSAAILTVPGAAGCGREIKEAEAPVFPSAGPTPPSIPKKPRRIKRFGQAHYDDYAWLKHPDWFQSISTPSALDPEIRAHLETENAYCDAVLEGTKELQDDLFNDMQARTTKDDGPPPAADGPWEYFTETKPGSDYPAYLRRPRDGGAEELLLDVAVEAQGKSYYRITGMRKPYPSPDHRYFAWMADDVGDERYKLRIKDIESGALVGDVIEEGYGPFEFSPDSKWIYWVHRDEMSRPVRVHRRLVVGGPIETVIEESDPAFFFGLNLTASREYLLIRSNTADSSEVRFVKAGAVPRLVEPRTPGLRYTVEHWKGKFVILTNADGATDFKIMTASEEAPDRASWRDFVPHREGRYITSFRPYKDYLARIEWIDARPALVVRDGEGGEKIVEGRDEAYDLRLDDQGGGYDTAAVRYLYTSPLTPAEWRACNAAEGSDEFVKKEQAPWFDAERYALKRMTAAAPDGAAVPLTVLAPAGAAPEGGRPTLLFTYGAYGSSMRPRFSPPHLAMVDRGWVVALAHVRGGSERGKRWHTEAIKTRKRNTITDYIACAERLLETGYAKPCAIVGHSFSAGGIPIGGAINMRPGLWAGVIAKAPFVDVLNSIHDPTNPLLYIEYPEWGDPSDREVFEYVAGYSPYENVTAQDYPAVLATAGLLDDRVGYWEPAKWTARLRELTTSGEPVMLKTYMQAGHEGPTGRSAHLRQLALFFAFASWAVDPARRKAGAQ